MPDGLIGMQDVLEMQSLLHLCWGKEQDRTRCPWCGLIHKSCKEQSQECKPSLEPRLALSWKAPFGTVQDKAVKRADS